ncbi:MAG: type III polyketide synthase [Phycisphaerae bacterium]|nr:type III polyketide synthase [Phycisphaerae bacterium]
MSADPVIGLLGMGTATPHILPQSVAADMAVKLCCTTDTERAWLRRVYDRAGVDARGSVLRVGDTVDDGADMMAFYPPRRHAEDHGPTTAQRMRRYALDAPPLAARAAESALRDAGLSADSITHLITVSCTGFFAPGLDVALIDRLKLSSSVGRVHIGFMGCHAALNAIGVAKAIAESDHTARILVCCVELCSLHFAYGWRPDKLVANSLFGDGAAAVVIGDVADHQHPSRWIIRRLASRLMEESHALMGWTIGDHGFEMTLSPDVPARVRQAFRPWLESWSSDVEHWAIHPGGPKVITAVGEAMGLSREQLLPSRSLLAEWGNMSSGTVLFILDRLGPQTRGNCAVAAFGPGLMMEGMLVSR